MAIKIELSKTAQKQISKAPKYVKASFDQWIWSVTEIGWLSTCKQGGKGLHDEALKGALEGKRSIRLSKAWRLIYSIENGHIRVLSVTKHEYR